jgi:hypothetical protein
MRLCPSYLMDNNAFVTNVSNTLIQVKEESDCVLTLNFIHPQHSKFANNPFQTDTSGLPPPPPLTSSYQIPDL